MLSTLEAALMSYFTYHFEEKHNKRSEKNYMDNKFLLRLNPNEIKNLFCNYFDLSSYNQISKDGQRAFYLANKGWDIFSSQNNNGYQGVAFINNSTKEIVIAHRGTIACSSNWDNNIELLLGINCGIPKILDDALIFMVSIIRTKEKNYVDYKIYQTGHSLGGFLAEFGAAYVAAPKPVLQSNREWFYDEKEKRFLKEEWRFYEYRTRLHNKRPSDANAIAFDSLGSINVLNKLNIQPAKGTFNISNYFLAPNIANTANSHLGDRYMLLPCKQKYICNASIELPFDIWAAKMTHESHGIEKFIEQLKDPQTLYGKIFEWPSAINTINSAAQIENNRILYQRHGFLLGFATVFAQNVTNIHSLNHRTTGSIKFEADDPASSDMPFPDYGNPLDISVALNNTSSSSGASPGARP